MENEKKLSLKEIGALLDMYAQRRGEEPTQVFNDFLRYSCEICEIKEMQRAGGFVERLKECMDKNPVFFDAFQGLCQLVTDNARQGVAYDALGSLYESCFLTSHKASKTGQFFTPQSLCRLMAECTMTEQNVSHGNDKVIVYNDCACGSGRTLLAAWEKCDKYGKNYFTAQDIDTVSVMMCALNFMINGMIGTVECQDTLSQEWHYGYIVNAIKVPYANNCPSIERYDDRDVFRARERRLMLLMSMYDAEKYRPKAV